VTALATRPSSKPESSFLDTALIDALGIPVYTTDARGRITLFNEEAVELWGRRPRIGKDSWCGSWRIYRPNGEPLPHDECQMAVALKENRPVRSVEIVVERPDGQRKTVLPYPSPLRDAEGNLVGAVNALIDVTERKKIEDAASRLAAIVESSDDAIVSKDLNGTIRSWNPGAERTKCVSNRTILDRWKYRSGITVWASARARPRKSSLPSTARTKPRTPPLVWASASRSAGASSKPTAVTLGRATIRGAARSSRSRSKPRVR
jgi:PAS domain S-box-containing protein